MKRLNKVWYKLFFGLILQGINLQFGMCCFAQQGKMDSLLILLKTDQPDTNKLVHLNKISRGYNGIGSYDSAVVYANSALQLSNEMLNKETNSIIRRTTRKYEAMAYNNIGNAYSNQGKYPEALKNYLSCLNIRMEIGDKLGQAAAYNNIGNVFYYQGNYPEALKNNFASLKIYEAMGEKADIADSYNNIGAIYHSQNNYSEALKNYLVALKIREEIGDQRGLAASFNNIGSIHFAETNFDAALKSYLSSLKIRESMGDKYGISSSYNNIGAVIFEQASKENDPKSKQSKFVQALNNYLASLKIREEIGDELGIANIYNNIGALYTKQKKYNDADASFNKAVRLSRKIGNKAYLREIYRGLTNLDSARGNFKGAYENHKLYILYRDSLDNEQTRKQTIESQMTFDFEKKEAVAQAEHKKELESQQSLADEKSKKQKVIILFVMIGLLLVVAFAAIVFRSLRVTRRQKNIIEIQKDLVEKQKKEVEYQKNIVEEHQKEIIDSIIYARRIQKALLPTEKYIDKNLKRLKSK